MANQEINNGLGKKEYHFNALPENIRQIGEPPENNRIYIEDYVITYIHQIFQKKQEQAIVILLGKKGEGDARGTRFIYGAVEIELNVLEGNQEFTAKTWDKIHELIYQNFTGAQVFGWGCGVSMWNSHTDDIVRSIQQKHFSQEGKILFLEDLNEKEEKLFCWRDGKLAEMAGYVIYYEKNPLMQEYMLKGQPKKSFEESYDDKITATVRSVVKKNVELKNPRKAAAYGIGAFLVLLTILGANLLIQSTKKIESLEKTITTLSNSAVTVTPEPEVESKGKKKTSSGKQEKESRSAPEEKKGSDATTLPAATGQEPGEEGNEDKKTSPPATQKPEATKKPVATKPPQVTKKPKATKTPASKKKNRSSAQPASAKAASYVVRPGDTLSQIVWRQYHTLACMKMVKKANNIKDGDKIKEGQRIILPAYKK
ncbi:MAG: LysM peptidoglycan-binding domain-containing protein [Lachnospiraceae bacterium]|nr:LysM peptidoglycan-binding domain-containing protein [Lachnospiraceae bacterium]